MPVAAREDVMAEAAARSDVASGDMRVRLTGIRYAAKDISLFEFCRVDGGALPPAEPGSHVDVRLPNGLVRQYSLVESGEQPAAYTVAVKKEASGRGGSRYLHDQVKVGDELVLGAPRNNFPLHQDGAPAILIAGGIGITPLWCMASHLQRQGADWRLYYACRDRTAMAFYDSAARLDSVHLHFDDESGGAGLDLMKIVAEAPRDAHLYCCGPAPMLSAFAEATKAWPADRCHVEHFALTQPLRSGGGFTVVLAKSGVEMFVPEGRSIAHVLIEAGIDVATSCEQGFCGTCEVRVLDGAPEHNDSILSEKDRASNRTAMICCAGSKTERLVLDL